jgi:hypothetical protein
MFKVVQGHLMFKVISMFRVTLKWKSEVLSVRF